MQINKPSETCSSRKVAYSSFNAARKAGIHCRCQDGGPKLRPYYCPECGKYHLTSHTSTENHDLTKKGYKYNRLSANKVWKSMSMSITIETSEFAVPTYYKKNLRMKSYNERNF